MRSEAFVVLPISRKARREAGTANAIMGCKNYDSSLRLHRRSRGLTPRRSTKL
ncbi:hypothetical protein psageK4_057 [Pseudomonas phage psageK4]|uniref:Uncharacterized protein n=2 Tax=Otagovirus TaxID=2560197 RepID=A0AAE8XMD9_9CAUD|nr:hypothetical protein QGX14_gp178 [Pseudomonas phage psageK4]YP_010766971.1 hypothetical protein QGX15_gp181 [Pseudomonas phage psageK4e]QXV71711.1 hypothetical protein psageK4_057 [Pseudomonas phage psageK4]UAW53514.1 hypothetical protein psageK4e_066 [Pseudomonas phage psageK4e]